LVLLKVSDTDKPTLVLLEVSDTVPLRTKISEPTYFFR